MYVNGKVVYVTLSIVFLAIVLVPTIYFGTRLAELPEPQPAPAATPSVNLPQTTSPTEPPTPSPVLPAEKLAEPQAPPAETAAHSGPDLNGTWGLFVIDDDGEEQEWERFELEQRGDMITGRNQIGGRPCTVTLDGMSVTVVTDFEGRSERSFTGTMQASYREIAGTYKYVYFNSDPEKEDFSETLQAKLVHIPEAQLAQEKTASDLRKRRFEESSKIFDALKHFAERNGGKFPSDLAQITTADLDDLSLLANVPGRKIAYSGGAILTQIEGGADAWRKFKEQGTSKESLIELERNLREVWGGEMPFQTNVLRIEYDNPPLAIDIASSGDQRSSDEGETASPGEESQPEGLRESEFNNLKQLGIVCKMFSGENKEHLPGGWLMVYPEYLSDLRVLQSPWAPEGTVSYELLFPGETEKNLEALVTQLFESGAITNPNDSQSNSDAGVLPSNLQSYIPIVISQDELPAQGDLSPARAVLFLDGHVEAVALSEWDARITPFLRQ